jgi:hypothetical protein
VANCGLLRIVRRLFRPERFPNTKMKKKEREVKAAERVAAKERKQQERATATAQKSRDTLN